MKKANYGEFPGRAVVRTHALSLMGLVSIPDWGTKIPQTM